MSTGAAARVFVRLTRAASGRGTFVRTGAATVRLNSVRPLALSSELLARSRRDADEEVKDEPIKFSTSKASHRTWKVDQSMGYHFERPLWKVLPISLLATALLVWCFFRDEKNVDAVLGKQHVEKVPGLLSNEEDKAQK